MSRAANDRGVFYGWYVVGAVFFMVFVSAGFRQSYGVFVPSWTEHFGVSVSTISVVAAAGLVINGVSQPIVGSLADRYGPRIVMGISVLVLGLSIIAMALSTSIWILAFFYASFASFALGGAQFTPVTPLISRWFVRRRGTALSVLTSGASGGAMLIVPLSAYALELSNWRVALGATGVITIALALPLVMLVIRNRPEDMGVLPDGEKVKAGADGPAIGPPEGPLSVENWKQAYRSSPMWLLTLTYVVCGVTTAIIAVHFVQFAKTEGISETTAALAFGLLSFMNMIGVLGVGIVSDRIMRKNALTVIYAVRGLGFLALLVLPTSVGLWAFAVLAGSSWLATVPQTSALTAEVYGVRNAGTITGMLTMVHMIAGAIAVAVAGLMFDKWGSYDIPWAASVVLLVGASFAAWSLREKDVSSRFCPALPPSQLRRGAEA